MKTEQLTSNIIENLLAASEAEKTKKTQVEAELIQSAINKQAKQKKKAHFKMRVTEKFHDDFESASKKLGLSKTRIAEEVLKEVFDFFL